MAHQGDTNRRDADSASDEHEKLRRLVEIQRQIVELARHNELAQRKCEDIRRKLARRPGWKSRLASLLRRKRETSPFQAPPASAETSAIRPLNGGSQGDGQGVAPFNVAPQSPDLRL